MKHLLTIILLFVAVFRIFPQSPPKGVAEILTVGYFTGEKSLYNSTISPGVGSILFEEDKVFIGISGYIVDVLRVESKDWLESESGYIVECVNMDGIIKKCIIRKIGTDLYELLLERVKDHYDVFGFCYKENH